MHPASIWNQSLNGFFARLFTSNKWTTPWLESPALARACAYVSAFGMLAVSLNLTRKAAARKPQQAMDNMIHLALPLLYLIAPYSWNHHLVYVLPTIAAFLIARDLEGPKRRLIYYASILASAAMLAIDTGLQLNFKFFGVLILWLLAVYSTAKKLSCAPEARTSVN